MHAHPPRIPESQNLLMLRSLDHGGLPRGDLTDLSRGGGYECDQYSHATVHCMTLYMYSLLIIIRAFPSEGRTTWVRRYYNISKGFDAY
jgi:hypothetical protein